MRNRPWILSLAGLATLLVGTILLVWSLWPPPFTRLQVTCRQCELSQPYDLSLEAPAWVRLGQAGTVRLRVFPASPRQQMSSSPMPIPNNSLVNPLIEARLELPGGLVDPNGSQISPLTSGGSLAFEWNVCSTDPGELDGTLWVYQDTPPGMDGSANQRALAAFPLTVKTLSLAGMSTATLRVLAILAIALGLLLNLPAIGERISSSRPNSAEKDGPFP